MFWSPIGATSGCPDTAPTGLDEYLGGTLTHGWLAMGYMTSPAPRAFIRALGTLEELKKSLLHQAFSGAL
jgi:hypothetical protein